MSLSRFNSRFRAAWKVYTQAIGKNAAVLDKNKSLLDKNDAKMDIGRKSDDFGVFFEAAEAQSKFARADSGAGGGTAQEARITRKEANRAASFPIAIDAGFAPKRF
jgi:hypothetical protein